MNEVGGTPEEEMDAHILYGYGVDFILPLLAPDAIWVAPSVAPLPASIIERELRRIGEHERFKPGHTIIFYSNDRKMLTLTSKGVQVEDDPDHDLRPPA